MDYMTGKIVMGIYLVKLSARMGTGVCRLLACAPGAGVIDACAPTAGLANSAIPSRCKHGNRGKFCFTLSTKLCVVTGMLWTALRNKRSDQIDYHSDQNVYRPTKKFWGFFGM